MEEILMKKTLTMLSLAATLGGTAIGTITSAATTIQAADASISSKAQTTQQQQFIQKIAAHAQNCATQYGLYTSVMMAQAILESGWGQSTLSLAPNYNLFGIKAGTDWTGDTVSMQTQEWDANAGKYVTIMADFRKYPSFFESFTDNAKKLRLGPGAWNPSYYSGTWIENTKSYQDATAWLQGRYATDVSYASKLNRVITDNNLTQYDPKATAVNKVVTTTAATTVYNQFNGPKTANGQVLPAGTSWKANKQITMVDGTIWYDLGNNQWASSATVKEGATNPSNPSNPGNSNETVISGVARVNYVPGYSIAIWDKPGNDRQFTGKKLLHGTDWKVFKRAVVDGQVWYNLGGNQWLQGKYVTYKA